MPRFSSWWSPARRWFVSDGRTSCSQAKRTNCCVCVYAGRMAIVDHSRAPARAAPACQANNERTEIISDGVRMLMWASTSTVDGYELWPFPHLICAIATAVARVALHVLRCTR